MISFISQVILHGLSFCIILFVIYPLFGIDLTGSAFKLIGLTFIFFIFLYLLSVIVGLQKEGLSKALEMIVFFATPGFIFSGYTFPLRGMPKIYAVGQYFPFTVYLNAVLKCAYMKAPGAALEPELTYTFIAGCVLLVLLSGVILMKEYQNKRSAQ
jgi:ABC-2 type transport system permease protein